MKKIFTLSIVLLFVTVVLAQPQQRSRLSISATGLTDLRVTVDGNRYRSNNGVVMITGLNSGYHTVKVYQVVAGRYNNPRGGNKTNYQQVYTNSVYIKPQYHTDITINRFGKAFVDEQPLSMGYYDDEDDSWGYDDNNYNNQQGNGQGNGGWGYRAMEKDVFDQLKQALQKESFSDNKLKLAKQALSNNYVSTVQVKELMNLFSFDDAKLDLAKYAYDRTVDRNNYFLLNDAFSFSNSKEELMKYIQDKK
ncbi:MAG: DUF4476 domain-containing protein [Ferruginibacter sp.]